MLNKLFRKHKNLTKHDVRKARAYIDGHWDNLTITQKHDEDTLIGLPNPYLVPAVLAGNEFEFKEMYYWDTYFMIQGMLDKKHKKFVIGQLENLLYMYQKFGIIPNASRTYMLGRSQPPLLTSFIWDVYEAYDMGADWLGQKLAIAMREYERVWMGQKKPHDRLVYEGLSRHYDINVLHDLAEAETGWDMTPRFNRKCLDYLPVDLNTYLYMYEIHFARYYRLIGDGISANQWEEAASQRKQKMRQLMYSGVKGLYFDYNYAKKRRGTVSSLAGLLPLWAGMVDQEQARKMVRGMKRFEEKGGLVTTDVQQFNIKLPGATPTQWAYPNGWAPLHFMIVKGLERYGFHDKAKEIAMKWLHTNLEWYYSHGTFLEKYNVVDPEKPPGKGLYPTPPGFGWSNAIFERFSKDYIDE